MTLIVLAAALLVGYACGNLPTASIVCRLLGRPDPLKTGSGNPGATNVARSGGKLAGALVLLGDAGKAAAPMWIAGAMALGEAAVWCVGIGAFAGHVFPHARKGGKGVATLLGCLAGASAPAALAFAVIWLSVAAIWRYSSVAGMAAAATSPLALWLGAADPFAVATCAPLAAIVLWRHRDNVQALRTGVEDKIGE